MRGLETGGDILRVQAPHRAAYGDRLETGDDPAEVVERTIVLRSGAEVVASVVDEGGKPVGHAYVELENKENASEHAFREFTDDNGSVAIADVGAGTYAARASSDDDLPAPDATVALDGEHPQKILLHVVRGAEVAGRVVDETGTGIADAQVWVGSRSVQSGADGAFVARALEPGDYDVAATTKLGGATSIRATLAARAHADVRLVVHAFAIAGVVVDEAGAPVEAAQIIARSDDPHGVGTAVTDERGRFDLGGLPPGAYELTAERNDHEGPSPTAPPTKITATTRALRIVLPALGGVTGRVVEGGAPVAYYGVYVTDDETIEKPRPIRDADGRFKLKNLSPGAWSVVVVGPGFQRKTIVDVRIGAGGTTDLGDIAVEGGRTVAGRVVDASGAGVAGARVVLAAPYSREQPEPLIAIARGRYTATSGADGAFHVDGVTPNDDGYSISATHPTRGASQVADLADGVSDIALRLEATGALDVRVPESANAYSVTARADGNYRAAHHQGDQRDGAFHFDLPPGSYEISAVATERIERQTVEVTSGGRAIVQLVLQQSP